MERDKALDMAVSQIERQFGKGAIMKMGEVADQTIEVISTGALSLDLALGIGGVPRGRIVELYGPESSGKTSLALHIVAEAQRNGGIAAFIDAEHALDPVYAKAIGVDVDELLISQPDTGEQALEIADMLIRSGALDVLVIDSVAALVPRAEIEGEMGDAHVGLQARLMSQALRKLAGTLNKSKTTAIFINQLREKIGVMFGCFSYGTRVTLADGTQEKIGKIVNQRMPVEVMAVDPESGKVEPKKIVNWFDNGNADEFLQFTVYKPEGNGRAQFGVTANHLISTPGGWKEAGELLPGDRVLMPLPHYLSNQQRQLVLGSLMADGSVSPKRAHNGGAGIKSRFRFGHGPKQNAYAEWKASLLEGVPVTISPHSRGGLMVETTPLVELDELRSSVYVAGKKVFSWDYLKELTPFALAIWYMDDGTFAVRRRDGSAGRSDICVQAMEKGSQRRLLALLRETYGLSCKLIDRAGKAVIVFDRDGTEALHKLIAPYVPEPMSYKLLQHHRGRESVVVEPAEKRLALEAVPILDIHVKPPTRSMRRFDLEIEGHHNYLADGVMVHNSPETTPGGRALKFYSSVRLDIRRIETIKDGTDSVGNRVKVKVAKNKCVAAGTAVFDPTTGLTHRIEDVVESEAGVSVVAADKSGKLHTRTIGARLMQGEQEVIGIQLRSGEAIKVTPDHKMLTDRGWTEAGSLQPGDRIARPRRVGRFGEERPIEPEHARQLGYRTGDGSGEKKLPPAFFADGIDPVLVSEVLFGLWETDGWVSREQTGGVRVGFVTTSEQLAHQIHWLLLRFGIGSNTSIHKPGSRRSIINGREVRGKRDCWQIRVSGIDNVRRFAEAIPMWGPRGSVLVGELQSLDLRGHRGSQMVYLPPSATEPVLAYLRKRGVSSQEVGMWLGAAPNAVRGGLRMLLGVGRLRRDRVEIVADALDSEFLREFLEEELWYDRVWGVTEPEMAQTYDIEVEELHNFVANDLVVHNCAPPFRLAEFDIMFGHGISREGSLLDVAVDHGVVNKSGAWFTFDDDQLGQGRENAKRFLRENPEVAMQLQAKVYELVGLGASSEDDASTEEVVVGEEPESREE